ncbi:V-type ATP synthase subunit I [Clostridia bacterium]|nr:V-type ATP synthase subunit I [Clostridia bacterium]
MIETMRYVNIMGPKSDLDRVSEKYLVDYEIQLENAVKDLPADNALAAFSAQNPYGTLLRKAEKLARATGLSIPPIVKDLSKDEAERIIEYASDYFDKKSKDMEETAKKREEVKKTLAALEPFKSLSFNLSDLRGLKYINCKFGKLPIPRFQQYERYLYKDPEMLFVEASRNEKNVFGVYFSPQSIAAKADSSFASLQFEPIVFPERLTEIELDGAPADVCERLTMYLSGMEEYMHEIAKSLMDEADLNEEVKIVKSDIIAAHEKLKRLSRCYDVRRYAALADDEFYIVIGWMPKGEADRLERDIADDAAAIFVKNEVGAQTPANPPTRMKNNFFVRPFEMFVKNYGLPAYNEIDPTAFVAVTYTILFGMMFGDVGQGLSISLIGLALWRLKGITLGKIMSIVGLSSAFFGLVYGSVFGFEFHGLWLNPAESANVNTILMLAVAAGVLVIVLSMSFNFVNKYRQRKIKGLVFDVNGFAGTIFYISVLAVAVLALLNGIMAAWWVIAVFIIIPGILLALREPLTKLLEGENNAIPKKVGMFVFESVIEIFEVCLSFFSNTVSFVRVGAFALSHASMMGVVMMLAGAEAGGTINPLVVIFGNLLVMALEGFVVGIQVLRLEFYEVFSRFYSGTGRVFTPYGKD